MSNRTPFRRPTYSTIFRMEDVAANAADHECNMRLWWGNTTAWLVVRAMYEMFSFVYIHQVGREQTKITREDAQRLIDKEWQL